MFKKIKNFPGYLATRGGKIYSQKSKKYIGHKATNGYIAVTLKGKTLLVHRLIAETFLKKQPGKNQVNHKNRKRHDNRVKNLEWCSSKENTQHGLSLRSDRHKINVIRKMKENGLPSQAAANIFKMTSSQVRRIARRESWGSV